jgi:mono/diheme cytochrome c family protein
MARGLAVYQTYYCGACHQLDATGSKGIFGPPHNAMGVIARARVMDSHYTGRATTAEEYLIESILDPSASVATAPR